MKARKWIATIIADAFLIFGGLWIIMQLSDSFSRQHFFSFENIVFVVFPLVALWVNHKLFERVSATAAIIAPQSGIAFLENCYLGVLAVSILPILAIPFTFGFSLMFGPLFMVPALCAMTAILVLSQRENIRPGMIVLFISLAVAGGVLVMIGAIYVDTEISMKQRRDAVIMQRNNRTYEKSPSDRVLPAPISQFPSNDTAPEPSFESKNEFNLSAWINEVESRFSEYDLINNVLVLNDVTERFFEKHGRLPAHSAEFTSFVASLKPRYKNEGEGWIYSVLYRKKSEETYELCVESISSPEKIEDLGVWQQDGAYYCLQRKL